MKPSRLNEIRSSSWRTATKGDDDLVIRPPRNYGDLLVVVTTALSCLIIALLFSLA